jgi:YbbR domain-containing protein
VLDLRAARPGRRLFHVTGADVRAPFGIEVVQVGPSNISMTFEPSSTKIVPVVPEIEGDPRPGYVVGTVTAEPPTVEVVGPKSAVDRLTEAITEPVSIGGADETVSESVNVGVPDPTVRLSTPQSARVTVAVAPAPEDWSVSGLVVKVSDGQRPVQLTPRTVTVHVRGPREARGLQPDAFDASVDIEGLSAGQFELPVRVVPPPRLGIVRVEPAQVRVQIQ